MLKLASQDVKILHLEPTDACNAACPQCSRETDTTFDKNNLHQMHPSNEFPIHDAVLITLLSYPYDLYIL